MSRWIFGNKKHRSVIDPQFRTDEKLVSCLDLVQTLAIKEIRLQRRIPLLKVRQAIKTAREVYQMSYPFARKHVTFLLGDELVIHPCEGSYVEASGQHAGQPLLSFVEEYVEDLTFDSSGLASKYKIFALNGVDIQMSPKFHFGEPLLPSNYSARSIWESVKAEGSIERTAQVYGIPITEVQAAYRFFLDIQGKAA